MQTKMSSLYLEYKNLKKFILVYKKTIILVVEAKPNLPQSIDFCGKLGYSYIKR